MNDCRKEMMKLVEKYALDNLSTFPRNIWDLVSSQRNKKYGTYSGASDRQVVNKVRNSRYEHSGRDIATKIEDETYSLCKDSTLYFLRKCDYNYDKESAVLTTPQVINDSRRKPYSTNLKHYVKK